MTAGDGERGGHPHRRLELVTDVFRRPAAPGGGFDEKTGLKVRIDLDHDDARAILRGLALGRGLALPPRRVDWGFGPGGPELLAVQPGGPGFLYFCDARFARRSGHVPVGEIAAAFGLGPAGISSPGQEEE